VFEHVYESYLERNVIRALIKPMVYLARSRRRAREDPHYGIAAEWYQKAAGQDLFAESKMGVFYLKGQGVSQDYYASGYLAEKGC